MVVDDELDIVVIFRQVLTRHGYTVYGFTDPILALEHFRTNADDYALVISDIRMPQMNGFEFAAGIKAIKPDAKIVLMSAFEASDFELSTLPIKPNDFLSKPVDIETLVNKIRVVIAN